MRRLIRAAARLAYRTRGYQTITLGGARVRTDPDHIGFWRDVSRGRWEPDTFRFLEQALPPGSVLVDIGAWIGPTTLFAAQRCRHVYAFEPDPDAYRYLLWNLKLNAAAHVVPFHAALGTETGLRRLWGAEGRLGTSTSSLLPATGQPSIAVAAISWADWMAQVRPGRIDAIKMDIEGGEFELIPALREYLAAERPALHLSLHATRLPDAEREAALDRLLRILSMYPDWRDESGAAIDEEAFRRDALERERSLQLSPR